VDVAQCCVHGYTRLPATSDEKRLTLSELFVSLSVHAHGGYIEKKESYEGAKLKLKIT